MHYFMWFSSFVIFVIKRMDNQAAVAYGREDELFVEDFKGFFFFQNLVPVTVWMAFSLYTAFV